MEIYDISIILPCYNAEEYMDQCILSLLNQTKEKIQIILVNDGSTDNSSNIINHYAEKNATIVVVNQPNQGLASARIAGYKVARGKYIGWVDADDFVTPEMYQVLYDLSNNNNAELVYCNYDFYPHEVATKVKWFKDYKGNRDWRFIDKNSQFWNKLFSKKLLDRVDIISLLEKYGEYSVILPMLEANRIENTNRSLYLYRVGQLSMSGGSYVGKVPHYLKGIETSKHLETMIENTPYFDELKEYFEYRYIYTLLLLALVSAKNKDKEHYQFATDELNRMNYKNNKYINTIIKEHYGRSKSYVIAKIIPNNYEIACLVTTLLL